MNETKLIKGQAWIYNDVKADGTIKSSLVQDQIMVVPGVDSFSNTVCLIDDIWADLTSTSGQYKTNNKGYFYWEYKQTLVDNPDVEVTVNFECPKPKEGLLTGLSADKGDYVKYWLGKFKTAEDNYEEKIAIQKKEIKFPKSEYLDWETGQYKEVEESTVLNDDLGTIENLLNTY